MSDKEIMEEKIKKPNPPNMLQIVDTDLFNQKIDDFDFNNPSIDPKKLAEDLHYTMHQLGGIGLSANQCGLNHRVFVLRTEPPMTVYNPSITWYDDNYDVSTEGCLSSPGMFVKVRRPKNIRAKWTNENGEIQTQKFGGMSARVFQHELDHLNGIDFLDRASPINVKKAKDKLKNLMRKVKKQ